MLNLLGNLTLDRIRELPPIRRWRRERFDREFERGDAVGTFRGVYPDFRSALADVPASSPTGYDQPGTGQMYSEVLESLREWDYPVLFWLSRFSEARRVFDYGGHVGILFYGFSRYLDFPAGFQWTVCDVPAVNRAGEALAEDRGATQLSFTNDFRDVENGYDVLLASGSLQYVEEPFYETLAALRETPERLLINMLPLHDEEEFVTVSSMAASYCAYKVHRKRDFLEGMERCGWSLQDMWENPGKTCVIPFHERESTSRYYGMSYVRRA
jgi:putative methyltransferase (TIGR04325 family)